MEPVRALPSEHMPSQMICTDSVNVPAYLLDKVSGRVLEVAPAQENQQLGAQDQAGDPLVRHTLRVGRKHGETVVGAALQDLLSQYEPTR